MRLIDFIKLLENELNLKRFSLLPFPHYEDFAVDIRLYKILKEVKKNVDNKDSFLIFIKKIINNPNINYLVFISPEWISKLIKDLSPHEYSDFLNLIPINKEKNYEEYKNLIKNYATSKSKIVLENPEMFNHKVMSFVELKTKIRNIKKLKRLINA